jgi:GAF domain
LKTPICFLKTSKDARCTCMEEPETWYELLGQLVDTPQARQSLANQLGISVVTVTRWIAHTSNPRPATLRAILNIFPERRNEFVHLFARDHIHWQEEDEVALLQDEATPSAEFYAHLLSIYRQISPTLRSATIQQLILADALEHLDSQRLGIACVVLLCLPPRGGNPIRSLYIAEGRGTPPWPQDLRQTFCLLGAESLAGAVTTAGRSLLVDRDEERTSMIPSRWGEHERSAVAAPIMQGQQVAGCLLVSSTRPGTFLASQQQRIVCYADLLILAIAADQWYDHKRVCLQMMPSKESQGPLFARLPQQIVARMTHESSSTYVAVRQRIMQEIEETLIQLEEVSYSGADPRISTQP